MRVGGSGNIKLSIIIPAYNEEKVIGSTLDSVSEFLDEQGWKDTTEVIVVAADGTDSTKQIAEQKSSKFTHFNLVKPGDKVGKGRDVAAGFAAARGEIQLFTDADLATPLHHIPDVIEKLEEGAELVIGVREIATIHQDFLRKFTSQASNLLIRIMAVPGVSDTQCGFKAFRAYAAKSVFAKQTIMGWGFDIEILAIARKLGYKRELLPIPDWRDPKPEGEGLVGESQVKAMIHTLLELFRVRLNLIKGVYK